MDKWPSGFPCPPLPEEETSLRLETSPPRELLQAGGQAEVRESHRARVGPPRTPPHRLSAVCPPNSGSAPQLS